MCGCSHNIDNNDLKYKEGGSVDAIDNPRALGTALKKVFKNDYGIDIDTRYIKTVRGLDGSWYEISTFKSGHIIPNEVRKEMLELSLGKPLSEMGIRNPNDIHYGNVGSNSLSVYGHYWKEWLKGKKFEFGGDIEDEFTDYYLKVNLDERGYYSADVLNPKDKIVYSINSAEEMNDLIESGFLKYKADEDLNRLTKYLMSINIIPNYSQIYSEEEFDDKIREYSNGGGVGDDIRSIKEDYEEGYTFENVYGVYGNKKYMPKKGDRVVLEKWTTNDMYRLFNESGDLLKGDFSNKEEVEKYIDENELVVIDKIIRNNGGLVMKYSQELEKLKETLGVSQIVDGREIYDVENTKNIGKILGVTTNKAYQIMSELEKQGVAFKYGYKTRGGWEDVNHSSLHTNSLYWQIIIPIVNSDIKDEINEDELRLEYALEDIKILDDSLSGAMSITDTKHGLLDLSYSKETGIYEIYNQGNKLYEGDRKGAIEFVADSYVIDYDDNDDNDEGIDLFEDIENIPENVQEILDEHQQAFEDGDYRGLEQAHKELEAIGYTFDYYLDGQAYDLRPIGTKGKVELASEKSDNENNNSFENGGVFSEEIITPKGRKFIYTKRNNIHHYIWENIPEEYLRVVGKGGASKTKLNNEALDNMADQITQNYFEFKDEKYSNGGGVDKAKVGDLVKVKTGANKGVEGKIHSIEDNFTNITIKTLSGHTLYGFKLSDLEVFKDGGNIKSYQVVIDNDYDNAKSFRNFNVAKNYIIGNYKNHDTMELLDEKYDSIMISKNDDINDVKNMFEFEEGGTIDSVRRFTEGDFNKLMDDKGFRATWSGYVWEIYPEGGGRVLGKFNPKKHTLFITGKKDLTNELVKYLQQNSYVTNEEYFKLEKGGIFGNVFGKNRSKSSINKDRKYFNKNEEHEVQYAKTFKRRKKTYDKFDNGGNISYQNALMVINDNKQIKHHTEELNKIVDKDTEVPAWVVSKVHRSASDLSDATHYLDGVNSEFGNGGLVDENSKIKDWYIKEYSSDDLGKELNNDSTFKDLLNAILNGNDVYSVLGVGDSVVRERAFAKLSKINNKEPQWAYNSWLMYSNGGIALPYSFASEGISEDRFKERQKAFVGYLGDVISIQTAETFLGRKINSWKDDVITIGDTMYKKVYLRPEYKRMTMTELSN